MPYWTATFSWRPVFVIPFAGDGAPTSRLCFLNISIYFYLLTQTTIKEAVKKTKTAILTEKDKNVVFLL